MPSLILHIGTAKTGTTAIQHFLAANRDALAAQGVVVPSFLGNGPNHRWLPLLAQGETTRDGFTERQGLGNSPEQLRAGRAAKRLELRQAAGATADATWIISSEQLYTRLSARELLRLRRLLQPLFEDIRVLVYLRQPLPAAISAWSTRTRSGRVSPSLPPPQSFAPLCDHAASLRRWQQVFGQERLVVRLFDPAALRGGSLIEDFCSCSGIANGSALALPTNENRSLSYQAIKLLWHLQQRLHCHDPSAPVPPPAPRSWRWRALVRFVERSLAGFPPYQPTVREREAFASYYAASERWVCRVFFPERERLWDPSDPPVRQEEDPRFRSALTAEESALVAMLAELWCDRADPPGRPTARGNPDPARTGASHGSSGSETQGLGMGPVG
ncbi:MAG: hypothetical protein VKK43_10005 [Synechococcaceae cyanobacterium]|nr:hypothetical protein [Synechococcaceae cyanobacterium]